MIISENIKGVNICTFYKSITLSHTDAALTPGKFKLYFFCIHVTINEVIHINTTSYNLQNRIQ